MKYVSLKEVELVAHRLAQKLLTWDEPIPDFGTRFPSVLESCLMAIRQSAGGRIAYKGTTEKAAALFYFMIKNHPFQNGNKRIAVVTLLYFLQKNSYWLQVDNHELYEFARWVAASNARLKNEVIDSITAFLKLYLTREEE